MNLDCEDQNTFNGSGKNKTEQKSLKEIFLHDYLNLVIAATNNN